MVPTPHNDFYLLRLLDCSQFLNVEIFLADKSQPKDQARIEKKGKTFSPWHTSEAKAHLHDLLNDDELYVTIIIPSIPCGKIQDELK